MTSYASSSPRVSARFRYPEGSVPVVPTPGDRPVTRRPRGIPRRRSSRSRLRDIVFYERRIVEVDDATEKFIREALKKTALIKKLNPKAVIFFAHVDNPGDATTTTNRDVFQLFTYSSMIGYHSGRLTNNHPAEPLLMGRAITSSVGDTAYPRIGDLAKLFRTTTKGIKVCEVEGIPAFYARNSMYLPIDILHAIFGSDAEKELGYIQWFLDHYLNPPKLIPFLEWVKGKRKRRGWRRKKKSGKQVILEALNASSKVKKAVANQRVARCLRTINDSKRRIGDERRRIEMEEKVVIEGKKELDVKERIYTLAEVGRAMKAIPHIIPKKVKIAAAIRKTSGYTDAELKRRIGYVIGEDRQKEIALYKFSFETDEIYIKQRRGHVLIGRFSITFNYEPDQVKIGKQAFRLVKIKNLTNRRGVDEERYDHPHIENTNPCWGMESGRVSDLLKAGDPIALLTYLIVFLQSYNSRDPLLRIGYWTGELGDGDSDHDNSEGYQAAEGCDCSDCVRAREEAGG